LIARLFGGTKKEQPMGETATDSDIEQPAVAAESPAAPVGVAELPQPPVLVGRPTLRSEPLALPTALDAVPDTMLDGACADGLTVRAASVRGDDHRSFGETRQDSFGLWMPPLAAGAGSSHPRLLASVADGVGSQPRSHLGSGLVCRILGEEVGPHAESMLDPRQEGGLIDSCRRVVEAVSRRLQAEAIRRGQPPKALSTTVVAALFGGVTDQGRRAVVFAVGDSSAYVLRAGTFQAVVDTGADADLAGGTTDALPDNVGSVLVQVLALSPGDVVVLCTDGLANPMRNDSVRQHLIDWWGHGAAPGLPGFLWQLSFRAKSFGDDRTAVCVWIG
jgi:serine/threonine protein phosphatase PrpC